MNRVSTIRFTEEKVKEAFYKLEKGDDFEKELFKVINKAMDNLEENAFCGIQVPKRLIPKRYKVSNLWKYDLLKGWRLLYTIISEEKIYLVSIILDWMNHNEYEKKFKY